ncbi:transcription factor IIIB 90 kDa subunit isoform X2 [Eurytemora carolleeae]|uniref:transcription factor IIIB 90 kDa subunit isoform X2 n=1 Tax=Eurytemora carolleeae TaxID=1294199 RepID=UPI000C76D70D|nr:transcription factor IIIB 90 kDa subunit isoform X2 [Eurytemora carolleeae]|eukprot:XP_023337496.1 transcription factor IIIB 90 kDa subunit-like isoform X2 [Eurytemora affinis]
MSRRCKECGSTDIEIDSTRADAVCTNCGAVLESSIIVSDIQFEENAHGGSSAIGTFVSSESKGGKNIGGTFTAGIGRESREITLKNARKKIVNLAEQLRLRPDHIDMAFYFFKLALSKHLTRGRKSSHVIAACVYITCRTEGTSHMLIDFSDILQIDVYELGRTYLRLSQALCINIPAMDPCLYVMRFAHRLDFGEKTHEVSMTALRLVSRMKKDWIHFGRRPSGLCGAALLIAGRLHEFNRTINDVIKVVKVHESTLRKRLNEFGETPASQLTLEEFMTVDLDAMTEEQDPPSFKAARKKDRERLARLEDEDLLEKEMSSLEAEIEKELEERKGKLKGSLAKLRRPSSSDENSQSPSASDTDENLEEVETARFIGEETLGIISQCLDGTQIQELSSKEQLDYLLMPPPTSTPVRHIISPARVSVNSPGMGLRNSVEDYLTNSKEDSREDEDGKGDEDEELDLTGIDEDEIDSYIMTGAEIRLKTKRWLQLNAEYLLEQEEKIKREKIEREELIKAGKDPDKKRKMKKKIKMNHQSNGSAIEAIEKIVQEKKISTKINYDVLRSLNMSPGTKLGSELDDTSKQTNENGQINLGEERPSPDPTPSQPKKIKLEEAPRSIPKIKPNLGARSAKNRTTPGETPGKTNDKKSDLKPKRLVNFGDFVGSRSNKPSSDVSTSQTSQSKNHDPKSSASSQPTTPVLSSNQPSAPVIYTKQTAESSLPIVIEDLNEENKSTETEAEDYEDEDDEDDEDDEEEEEDEGAGELSAAQLLMQHMGGGGGGELYPEEEDYY